MLGSVLSMLFGAPDGEPADPERAETIASLIRQEWACLNANDSARVFALYTDDLIQRLFTPEGLTSIATAGTPEALPAAEQTALIAILDIEVLGPARGGSLCDRRYSK